MTLPGNAGAVLQAPALRRGPDPAPRVGGKRSSTRRRCKTRRGKRPPADRPRRRRFFGNAPRAGRSWIVSAMAGDAAGNAPRAGRSASVMPAAVAGARQWDGAGRNDIPSGTCRTSLAAGRPQAPFRGRNPPRDPENGGPREWRLHGSLDSRREAFGDLRRSESERRNDRIFHRLPDPNVELPRRSVQGRRPRPSLSEVVRSPRHLGRPLPVWTING